ncbi:phosphoribosylanthranilate isomerase [Stratiformator vulcanicus]|uniref:N-(5'-phosphoribosyl)anthranilate isomerase n=1 Tax=Stratiformator vulcanicus TaxID=2527980 RepID=A0A517QZ57_9PLAN|nr:phosphoribosylanthranilate isomerase [Stratiformator vulcanicus]QDT36921.1 N-(5'-phosphoribosyl)anthranilate isomerase [Stratiformator vulcanicus]
MWVKFCGLTSVEAVRSLSSLQPDALGLNFYDRSVRCVSVQLAQEMTEAIPPSIAKVGVFVNQIPDEVVRHVSEVGLDVAQFHGDESPELLLAFRERLPDTKVIKAARMTPSFEDDFPDYLAECDKLDCRPDYCLIDAHVKGEYGGTGATLEWSRLAEIDRAGWPPLILAGGLVPENLAEAIATVRPFGVDVAGGIEASPGVKNFDRARRFMNHCERRD